MPVGRGYLSYVALEEEVTWGTPVTAARLIQRMITDSAALEENFSEPPGLGTRAQRGGMIHGQREVGGDIVMEGNFEGAWIALLKHAMGNYAFTAATPNVHTITLAETLPPGLTIDISKGDVDTDKVFRYEGSKVDTYSFNLTPSGVLQMTAGIICEDETPNATRVGSAPTFPSELPIKWHYLASLTIAGQSLAAKVRAFDMQINNNLERRHNMQRLTAEPIPGGMREITGNVTLEFDSSHVGGSGIYDDLLAATTDSFGLTMTGLSGAQIAISSAGSTSQFTSGSPQVSGPGVMTVQYGFHILGTALTVNISNAQDQTGIATRA